MSTGEEELAVREYRPAPVSNPFVRGVRQEADAGGIVLVEDDEDVDIIPPQYDPSWHHTM